MSSNKYLAGCCNIGDHEIRVRQKFLAIFLLVTAIATIVSHFYKSIYLVYLIYFLIFSTIVLFIEVTTRFCILFAIFSLHNFKELGNLDHVDDTNCRKKDRIKALGVILLAMLVAFPFAWFIYKTTCL